MVEKVKEQVQTPQVFLEHYTHTKSGKIQRDFATQLSGFSNDIDLNHLCKNLDLELVSQLAHQFCQNEAVENPHEIPKLALFSKLAQELMTSSLMTNLRTWAWTNLELNLSNEGKTNEHVKALELEWSQHNKHFNKLNPLLMLKAWGLYKQNHLRFQIESAELSNQIDQEILNALKLSQSNPWLDEFISYFKQSFVLNKLSRELVALAYEQMVPKIMPLVQLQFRQALRYQGIGAKPLLLIYPHGKSGVMMLVVNKHGDLIDESMIYPYAPDYDEEQALIHFSKLMMKYPNEHVVWVLKAETRKPIQQILDKFRGRYPDLPWQLHQVANQMSNLLVKTKTPQTEDVLKLAHFAQHPSEIWANISCLELLNSLFRNLPQQEILALWTNLFQEHLLFSGINIQTISPALLKATQLFSNEDIKNLLNARELEPFKTKQSIQTCLAKTDAEFAPIAAFIRVQSSNEPLDKTPFIPEDKVYLEQLCLELGLDNPVSLLDYPASKLRVGENDTTTIRAKIKNLLNIFQQFHKKAQIFNQTAYPDLEQIAKHQPFYGLVTKIMPYGAFIDLGNGIEGLLHHSALIHGMNPDLKLILNEGDTVVVEWLNYDVKQKRLSLKYHGDYFIPKLEITKPSPIKVKKTPKITENNHKKITSLTNGPTAMALAFAKLKDNNSSN